MDLVLTWVGLVDILLVSASAGLTGAMLMALIARHYFTDPTDQTHKEMRSGSIRVTVYYAVATVLVAIAWGHLHGYY